MWVNSIRNCCISGWLMNVLVSYFMKMRENCTEWLINLSWYFIEYTRLPLILSKFKSYYDCSYLYYNLTTKCNLKNKRSEKSSGDRPFSQNSNSKEQS